MLHNKNVSVMTIAEKEKGGKGYRAIRVFRFPEAEPADTRFYKRAF